MIPVTSKLDSVDAIVNYLREPTPPEVVSSTTTSSVMDSIRVNNGFQLTRQQTKEKEFATVTNNVETKPKEINQTVATGRVRYGPITVNPRRQPSKTLFTGRRSKNEVLVGEEEEKRRLRRARNRTAATKCREKRENILNDLETAYAIEENNYTHLFKLTQALEQQKRYLESVLSSHMASCLVQQTHSTFPRSQQQPPKVFGDPSFLSSIMETPAPPLPPHQLELISHDEEEFAGFLQPTSTLINSEYNTDQSNNLANIQQQQSTITMTSSSLERMLNNLSSPTPYIDANKNGSLGLYNSTYGSASCARQHSTSSEDDLLSPTHKHSYIF